MKPREACSRWLWPLCELVEATRWGWAWSLHDGLLEAVAKVWCRFHPEPEAAYMVEVEFGEGLTVDELIELGMLEAEDDPLY